MKTAITAAVVLLLAVSATANLPLEISGPRFRGSAQLLSSPNVDHLVTDDASEIIKASSANVMLAAELSGPVCSRLYNNPIRSFAGQTVAFTVDYHCVHTKNYDMTYSGPLTVDVDSVGTDKLQFDSKEWGIVSWNEQTAILTIKGKVKFADQINVNTDAIAKFSLMISYTIAIPSKVMKVHPGIVSLSMPVRAAPVNMDHVPVCMKSIYDPIEVHPGDANKKFSATFKCKGSKIRFEKMLTKLFLHHTSHMKVHIAEPSGISFHVTGADTVDISVHGTVSHDKDDNADHGFRVAEIRVTFGDSQEVILSLPFYMPPTAAQLEAEKAADAQKFVDKSGFEELKVAGEAELETIDENLVYHTSDARRVSSMGVVGIASAAMAVAALL